MKIPVNEETVKSIGYYMEIAKKNCQEYYEQKQSQTELGSYISWNAFATWKLVLEICKCELFVEKVKENTDNHFSKIFLNSQSVRILTAVLEWCSWCLVGGGDQETVDEKIDLIINEIKTSRPGFIRDEKISKFFINCVKKNEFSKIASMMEIPGNFSRISSFDTFLFGAVNCQKDSRDHHDWLLAGIGNSENDLLASRKILISSATDIAFSKNEKVLGDFEEAIFGFFSANLDMMLKGCNLGNFHEILWASAHCLRESLLREETPENPEIIRKMFQKMNEELDIQFRSPFHFLQLLLIQGKYPDAVACMVEWENSDFFNTSKSGGIFHPEDFQRRMFCGYFSIFFRESFSNFREIDESIDFLIEKQIEGFFVRNGHEVALGKSASFLAEHISLVSPERRKTVWSGAFLELSNAGDTDDFFKISSDLVISLVSSCESVQYIYEVMKILCLMTIDSVKEQWNRETSEKRKLRVSRKFMKICMSTVFMSFYEKIKDETEDDAMEFCELKEVAKNFLFLSSDLLLFSFSIDSEICKDFLDFLKSSEYALFLFSTLKGSVSSEIDFISFCHKIQEECKQVHELFLILEKQKMNLQKIETSIRKTADSKKKHFEIGRSIDKISCDFSDSKHVLVENLCKFLEQNPSTMLVDFNFTELLDSETKCGILFLLVEEMFGCVNDVIKLSLEGETQLEDDLLNSVQVSSWLCEIFSESEIASLTNVLLQ